MPTAHHLVTLALSQGAAVQRPGQPPLPLHPRDAVLLAWLALEGPTARSRLARLLWPDSAADAAGNALRQRLFQLRRQAGLDLVCGQATLALNDGVGHDLADAHDVLAGLALALGPELADWLAGHRRQRLQRVVGAMEARADEAQRAGDWRTALELALALQARQPQSEAAHRRVMQLHYLAGDRAAALLAFDHCERMLKDEVGTRPSAQTLALLQTIEAGASAASSSSAAVMAEVPAAVLRPPRLVGRDIDLRRLAAAWRETVVVLLQGEAGMGKSRLLAEMTAAMPRSAPAAGPSAPVLTTGARPGDDNEPYALASRWLRLLIAAAGLELDAEQTAALRPLLPELGERHETAPAGGRVRMTAAVEALFAQALRRGLKLCIVDDLQFADAASTSLLQALVVRGDCGWVIAMRPAELGDAARALVSAAERVARTQVVHLAPLDASATAALIDSLHIDGLAGVEHAALLQARTGGNPLFMLETVKAAMTGPGALAVPPAEAGAGGERGWPQRLNWPVADTVLRVIQQRLARLSPLGLNLVRCAAAAGQDMTPALGAAVLGRRPIELAEAWQELEHAQMLRDGVFAHDLIADAVLAALPQAVARSLHAEVAAWLAAHDGEPGRVAVHWLAAREPLRAVPALLASAARARGLWLDEDAAARFAQAGEILHGAGRAREAFDVYFRAAEALSEVCIDARMAQWAALLDSLAQDDADRAAAACLHVAVHVERRRFDDARAVVLAALPLARRVGAADIEVELLWDLMVLDWERRELARAVQHGQAALQRLVDVAVAGSRLELRHTHFKLLHALGVVFAALGHPAEGDRHLEAAIDAARRSGLVPWRWGIAASLAASALTQGDAVRAGDWVQQAMADDAHDGIYANTRAIALSHCSAVQACCGDPGAALRTVARAAALCRHGQVRHDVATLALQASLHFELGRRDLALRTWRELAGRTDLHGTERPRVRASLLGAGEPLDAQSVLDEVIAIDDLPLRGALLCVAQPGCPPAMILPLLAMSAATAREQGAHGLWLALQGRRVAALRRAGRTADACEIARAAWQQVEQGVTGTEWFSRIGAELSAALWSADRELAERIALRTSAWAQQAASTLPVDWRETFLARAPALQVLPFRRLALGGMGAD